jgi:hypothetical protein
VIRRLDNGLQWIGGWMVRPFEPFLLWFMRETGLLPHMERFVGWLADGLRRNPWVGGEQSEGEGMSSGAPPED